MVTPITTLWVVGGWGQSGALCLVSIFNHHCIQFFLGLSPSGPISYKERQHSVENPLITYLLFPVLITEPYRMWVFSLSYSKICVCTNSTKWHVSVCRQCMPLLMWLRPLRDNKLAEPSSRYIQVSCTCHIPNYNCQGQLQSQSLPFVAIQNKTRHNLRCPF